MGPAICSICGRPVTKCVCIEEDEDEDDDEWEEDWGTGEVEED